MTAFNLKFKNTFAALPNYFYTKMAAEKVALNPWVIHANSEAAKLLDLNPELFTHPDFPLKQQAEILSKLTLNNIQEESAKILDAINRIKANISYSAIQKLKH